MIRKLFFLVLFICLISTQANATGDIYLMSLDQAITESCNKIQDEYRGIVEKAVSARIFALNAALCQDDGQDDSQVSIQIALEAMDTSAEANLTDFIETYSKYNFVGYHFSFVKIKEMNSRSVIRFYSEIKGVETTLYEEVSSKHKLYSSIWIFNEDFSSELTAATSSQSTEYLAILQSLIDFSEWEVIEKSVLPDSQGVSISHILTFLREDGAEIPSLLRGLASDRNCLVLTGNELCRL